MKMPQDKTAIEDTRIVGYSIHKSMELFQETDSDRFNVFKVNGNRNICLAYCEVVVRPKADDDRLQADSRGYEESWREGEVEIEKLQAQLEAVREWFCGGNKFLLYKAEMDKLKQILGGDK
jgi:predicted RNase H-like nuclease (RuvC/YqgF family)